MTPFECNNLEGVYSSIGTDSIEEGGVYSLKGIRLPNWVLFGSKVVGVTCLVWSHWSKLIKINIAKSIISCQSTILQYMLNIIITSPFHD